MLDDSYSFDEYDEFISQCHSVKSVENGKEVIKFYYMTNLGQSGDLDDFRKEWSLYKIKELISRIDNDIANCPKEELKLFLNRVIFDLDLYISKLTELNGKSIIVYLEDLMKAKPDIIKLCQFHAKVNDFSLLITDNSIKETNLQASNKSISEVVFPKFQWMGKTNILVTLFYDLLNGQDNREPLLQADKNELKKFLLANFLDADGNILSESTITTIFTPSKEDKRSNKGDRIELGNIKRR